MATDVSLSETRIDPARTPEASQVSDENDEISLLDFLIVLAARKRFILSMTFGFALVAAIISLVLPKRYIATSIILPPQQNSSMGSALISQLGSLGGMASLASGGLGIKNPNDMLVAMMKSRTVEDAMVEHFGLMQEYHQKYLSDARKDLEKHTSIDGSSKDGLIRISIEDRDPNRAAELANGYVDQFRNLSEHLAITEAAQRRFFFEQQMVQAKNNLANAEEALKRTELQTGLIQLDSQARVLIESAASLRAQIEAKEVQITSLQTFATGQNAQLYQAQQELASLRAQLAKLGGSEDNLDTNLIVPRGKVPQAGLEYVRKIRDVKYYETIFEILARQFEVAKLDEAKEGSVIQVVDTAMPPDKRSFPRRVVIVLEAMVIGFIIGTVIALFQVGVRRMKENPAAQKKINLLQTLLFRRKDLSKL